MQCRTTQKKEAAHPVQQEKGLRPPSALLCHLQIIAQLCLHLLQQGNACASEGLKTGITADEIMCTTE